MSKPTSGNDPRPDDDGDDVEIWGREVSHEEFVEGHYGQSRQVPTPEGGQAGIAQGNVRRTRDKGRRTPRG